MKQKQTPTAPANAQASNTYNNPSVGLYVDESAGSADRCNSRTIEFVEDYGFDPGLPAGCFCGTRGLQIEMTIEQAKDAAHQGECHDDAKALAAEAEIASQLDKIGAANICVALKESGGWEGSELADDEANRVRAVWLAAADLKENHSQWLSDVGDEAVSFLNDLESRSYMSWGFEDNSLFLMADVDSAREDVGFVSSKTQDYPEDDYRGEWLHVSDHGNATLYVRGEDGKDVQIWSVV